MQQIFLRMFSYKDMTIFVEIISVLHMKNPYIHYLLKLSLFGLLFQQGAPKGTLWRLDFPENFFFLFSFSFCQFGLKLPPKASISLAWV